MTTAEVSKWPSTVLQCSPVAHGERNKRRTLMLYMLSQVCVLEQRKKNFAVKSDLELYFACMGEGFFCLAAFFSDFIVKNK